MKKQRTNDDEQRSESERERGREKIWKEKQRDSSEMYCEVNNSQLIHTHTQTQTHTRERERGFTLLL